MNVCAHKSRVLCCQLILLCVALSLSSCADRAALRDKERAHYDNVESELISEQEAKNRRLREEYRVTLNKQQSNSEELPDTEQITTNESLMTGDEVRNADQSSTSNANTEQNARINDSLTDGSEPETVESQATKQAPDLSAPVVTQIVVGQSSEEDKTQNWSRQNYPSPIDGSPLCAIVSIPVAVQNGELATQVGIIISNDTVFLRTDATFDTEALDTGFQIDAGFPIPFDRYLNELTAVVDENYGIVLSGMKNGTTLSVSFSYKPQLSTADTHVVELTLDDFNKAWLGMDQCVVQPDG